MSDGFRLVCCLPSYREGPLVRSALRSVREDVDHVLVWEGPAGRALAESSPATVVPGELEEGRDFYREGRWGSDELKRTSMLKWCRERWHDRPLWILWLDADEVLVNAWALRDLVQRQMWEDECEGASIANPDRQPSGGIVLRYMEEDGAVSKEWGRLVRGDLIRRYVVSNLIVQNVHGQEMRLGRRPENVDGWRSERARLHGSLRLVCDPPLPGEPHFVHRSFLRHPYREDLRLHGQEHERLVELGLPTG